MKKTGLARRSIRRAALGRPARLLARARIRGLFLFLLFTLLGFLGGGCRARKAKLEDPCSFLTPAELQEVVGIPVEQGRIAPRARALTLSGSAPAVEVSSGRMCQYDASGATGNEVRAGTINIVIYTAAEYEKKKTATYKCGVCTAAGRCREVMVSPAAVPGVGESAFWFTPPPDTADEKVIFGCGAGEHFAALDITHAISIELPFARDGMDVESASIALAKKALPRFPYSRAQP